MNKAVITLMLAAGLSGTVARAQLTYEATLSGANESPVNSSTATGVGTVVLNAAMDQITVDLSYSGLTAPATAAHIHGPAAAGVNANVLFPFTGVPAATSGTIPEQTFAITSTELGYLQNGLLYMNVHDANFPGGEIRGQLLLVPEPGSVALLAMGLAGIAFCRARTRARKT